jgi:hypothetical protein
MINLVFFFETLSQEFEGFLSMLEHESVLNNEYDILLLPRGAWARSVLVFLFVLLYTFDMCV